MGDQEKLEKRVGTLFSQGRELVRHEDDLVDRRLKWVITIVAFIFAAYGATWIATPSQLESENLVAIISLSVVRFLLVCLGVFVSVLSATSILAAHLAVSAVNRKYRKFIQNHKDEIEAYGLQVWKLIGDGSGEMPGFLSSSLLPFIIAATCVMMAAFEFVILFYFLVRIAENFSDFWLYAALFLGMIGLMRGLHQIYQQATKHTRLVRYSSARSFELNARRKRHPSGSLARISAQSFENKMRFDCNSNGQIEAGDGD